jgi:8-oxo-dGTP diphosphatase
MLTLDMFIHFDAVDRKQWQGAADDRPLTDVGRLQAERMVQELDAEPVHAIFSSPAVRCRQSLEPLSNHLNLPIVVLAGFKDTLGYRAPAGWENPDRPGPDPLGGAQSAGSAFAALQEIRRQVPDGRAVLCSYGDIVPALLAFLSGSWGVGMPARNNQKGVLFSVRFDRATGALVSRQPAVDFPR